MQFNVSELHKKNNEMIKINSDLIRKVCSTEREDSGLNNGDNSNIITVISKVKRLEWFIQMQSGIIEDLIKQKSTLESKC